MKLKKCRDCKQEFEPVRQMQPRCIPCAIIKGKEKTRKDAARVKREARKAVREKLLQLKSRQQWLKEAQSEFNRYIRARDELAGLPCISCGRFHTGSYDAGHYRSVGAAPQLRFDEQNCHRQCVPCNQHKSGNAIEYRKGLIKRIGELAVERIENDSSIVRWTIDEAKRIKETYKAKLKDLISKRGSNAA